jgi:hypothetical protein
MDDDDVPVTIVDDGRGSRAPDGRRAMGDRIISPTDEDGSRVDTDWYTDADVDGVDRDDEVANGKLQIAVAATVGFFIIPQSITATRNRHE